MTQRLSELSEDALLALEQAWSREYELIKANRLNLDLSRGKPGADQLSLSNGLENVLDGNYASADGTDTRNYGNLKGLTEARELGAAILDVPLANVYAIGNSSLTLMHFAAATAYEAGLWGDDRRWRNAASPKILTPVPGYDRHFTICEALGIEMLNVAMTDAGPDVEQARELVAGDADIKGIWCVPKYSNPTGCTYSDEVVDAIAALPQAAAADDFVVFWDNAYSIHHLAFPGAELASVREASRRHGTEDHILQFASTSKVTFAGAGIAFIAASERVLDFLEQRMSVFTIGPDKVNQLRHARFLGGRLEEHMRAHAEILRPKFAIVEDTLSAELGDLDVAEWTHPRGGYFVSLDLRPGLAARVVEMAREVGLTLTPAGATFPYGRDPDDRNVRIAPTFAALDDLQAAMQTLTLCVKLASVRQIMAGAH